MRRFVSLLFVGIAAIAIMNAEASTKPQIDNSVAKAQCQVPCEEG